MGDWLVQEFLNQVFKDRVVVFKLQYLSLVLSFQIEVNNLQPKSRQIFLMIVIFLRRFLEEILFKKNIELIKEGSYYQIFLSIVCVGFQGQGGCFQVLFVQVFKDRVVVFDMTTLLLVQRSTLEKYSLF
eukprot:TRINITY_DN4838_c0_g1_i4.p4 TRINITY_DN4838_c0_g1~~TRINITY_DN4838_c0_g1_i4.p4  ORF type:complete len:129 (-),score=8.25 TRINITY_DN4838_c0_g1_i4:94-480(-)